MKLVHSVPTFNLNDGGPPRSVGQLLDHLVDKHIECHLIFGEKDGTMRSSICEKVEIHTSQINPKGIFNRLRSSQFAPILEKLHKEIRIDLVHNHGLWLRSSHDICKSCRKLGIPYVISPRGMLEPWALNQNGLLKRAALALYQESDLKFASALHATSQCEADNLRRMGFRQPIILLPNGILSNQQAACSAKTRLGMKRLLFLSRISPKKNIPTLLRAWQRLRPEGWELCIAGNGKPSYMRKMTSLAESLELGSSISFWGPRYGTEKDKLYRCSDLFVLPTFSENFGIVVAEALSYGLPVITTKGTPWSGLIKNGCGWWIDPVEETLYRALKEATALTDSERSEMGARGISWVNKRFAWDAIASKMIESYEWLLGQTCKPDCVIA